MKLFDLHEASQTSKYSQYLRRLIEKTKSFVPPVSDLNDALGDADIYPIGRDFLVAIPTTVSFTQMDIADLYDGSRKMKRELRARTAKTREVSPDFEAFKKHVKKMIRVWQFYGLRDIVYEHGKERYTASAEEFNPDEAFKLDDKMRLFGSLKLRFYDDFSLDKE